MDYTHRVESLSNIASATLLGIGVCYGLISTMDVKLGLETRLGAFTHLRLENDLHLLQIGLAYHF